MNAHFSLCLGTFKGLQAEATSEDQICFIYGGKNRTIARENIYPGMTPEISDTFPPAIPCIDDD
jgi:hypothetical protein